MYGQNSTDALRFSRFNYEGTARFQALGGSMGAVGGDISSLVVNPAAVGVYRNSEFIFSNAFFFNDQESTFRGNSRNDNRLNFNLGNIGFVGAYKGDPNGWKNYSFAVGYNRINSFAGEYTINGSNVQSSIIDDYVFELNNSQTSELQVSEYAFPFGASQAYWMYLIDPVSGGFERSLIFQESINQTKKVNTRGRQGETFFSFGGNYLDRFYLGGTIGIQNLRYEQTITFTEDYSYDPPPQPGESLATEYEEETELITTGTGINFKLGGIFRVTNQLRIGASVHSPTFFGMTESFEFNSKANFSDTAYTSDEGITNYNYRYRTPTRYNASIAYVLGNKGLINIDYEYVDFSTSRFNDTREFQYDYSYSNEEIQDFLKGTHNLRAGLEVKVEPFVIRGGVRYEENPYQSKVIQFNPDENRMTYSIGGGFRAKNYTLDLAYVNSNLQRIDNLYLTSDAASKIDQRSHQLVFSLGWKW